MSKLLFAICIALVSLNFSFAKENEVNLADNSVRPLKLSFVCSVTYGKEEKKGYTFGLPDKNDQKLVEIKNVNTSHVFHEKNGFKLSVSLYSYSSPTTDEILKGYKSALQLKIFAEDKLASKNLSIEASTTYYSPISIMISSRNAIAECHPTIF